MAECYFTCFMYPYNGITNANDVSKICMHSTCMLYMTCCNCFR